ncbi:hypothetical protein DACRYDRAFT_21884 [Dacryopinax primogenitus]|uniref:Chromo domain-containing protein n=1 Tax=Dacryopinax primogenitus (strain DJM 731) TaxID=1858805 RepID=M5G1M5_DACPD|nr:uncharacterized protein DACRYDRAFT_21884 [Dacryopinax primogenitus]EJU02115.1 hypothetical protein DACRYDRAFT_21884 [Dacryopinax primogenitus]
MTRARRQATKPAATVEQDVDNEASEDSEDDEEGYEVEEILDVKKGGAKGSLKYYVKWNEYDESENSWVTAEDAAGAPDVIEKFWKSHEELQEKFNVTVMGEVRKDKPTPAKSGTSRKPAREKPRASAPAVASHPSPVRALPRRRALSDSPPPPPKVSSRPAATPQAAIKRKREPDDSDAEDHTMAKYMKKANWEDLVIRVDNIAGNDNSVGKKGTHLRVYLKLKDGQSAVSTNIECNKRCPQKMLAFYEGKLKFRTMGDGEEGNEEEGED